MYMLIFVFGLLVFLHDSAKLNPSALRTAAASARQALLTSARRSTVAPAELPAELPAPHDHTPMPEVVAQGWEPMSSRELFAKIGMPDGFDVIEYPRSSKALFESLGMPNGYPVLPETEPVAAQPVLEVSVDLPPEILREEEPLQPWEIAYAETVDA